MGAERSIRRKGKTIGQSKGSSQPPNMTQNLSPTSFVYPLGQSKARGMLVEL